MQQISFSAFGTEWMILIDHPVVAPSLAAEIRAATDAYEQRFSRFILTSEVNAFRQAPAGTYRVSPELAHFLQAAQKLKNLSQGRFDPAVGGLLELAGYDPAYSFQPDSRLHDFSLADWKIIGRQLTLSDPVVFDTGGIGKGYWIDQLSQLLEVNDYQWYLVDGGGDMYGTTKANGQPWQIALEWPGQPDTALGQVELDHQGLAVSDTFKRRWQNWHHFVDIEAKQSTTAVTWCAALAETAFVADQMTSLLALCPTDQYAPAALQLQAEYAVLQESHQLLVSPSWSGKWF